MTPVSIAAVSAAGTVSACSVCATVVLVRAAAHIRSAVTTGTFKGYTLTASLTVKPPAAPKPEPVTAMPAAIPAFAPVAATERRVA